MPELPEVEVVRRGLESHTLGATFRRVEVLHPRANRGQDYPLSSALVGASIVGWSRRGKYLWAQLSTETALFVHLGMSGQMLLGEPGQVSSPHVRIRAELEPNSPERPLDQALELAFVDQRTFGRWLHCEFNGELPQPVSHIAPDPFSLDFDLRGAARAIRARRPAIKTVLLNQEVVSGIGNIYADEALWRARINPLRPAHRLLQREAVSLLEAAAEVMTKALAAGGTSFDELYVNVNGASGYFSRSLNVYGQRDQPCIRCAHPIKRVNIGGRSTHYCPQCQ